MDTLASASTQNRAGATSPVRQISYKFVAPTVPPFWSHACALVVIRWETGLSRGWGNRTQAVIPTFSPQPHHWSRDEPAAAHRVALLQHSADSLLSMLVLSGNKFIRKIISVVKAKARSTNEKTTTTHSLRPSLSRPFFGPKWSILNTLSSAWKLFRRHFQLGDAQWQDAA